MKNQNILLTAAITMFVMSSACKKDQPIVPEAASALKFASTINGQIKTKAINDTWETSDAIGVFMKTGAGLSNVISANKNYNTSGDGEFKPSANDQAIYYPEDGSSVDFVAYYPFRQTLTGNFYAADVSDQSIQNGIDLMYSNNARGLSKTSTLANLNFSHQLSKIEFTVKNGSGVADLNGLSTAIAGLNTKADFNIATGTLGSASAVSDIVAKTTALSGSSVSELIVLPVEDAAGKTVTFTLPAGIFKLTLPSNTKFESGKKYTYTIELKNGGTAVPVAVTLSATIANWTNVPGGAYVVDQDKDVVTPPAGEDKVLYNETFGTGTISSTARPKLGAYTNFDNKSLTFSDSFGNADMRTISTYGEGTNAHVWLPASKDATVLISGVAVSGYSKLKIRYDAAANIQGGSAMGNLNVIKVKVNGIEYAVTSQPIIGADTNKFYTLEVVGDVPALASNTVEFFGQAGTNTVGLRLDNVIITGTNK